MLTLAVKPQWVCYKSLVLISYRTPQKCVRLFHPYNGYPAAKDNHDSIGMCTTFAECKTVITAMLMGMIGMDPHMISSNLRWASFGLVGFVEVVFFRLWVGHGETL
jgi:hypothetical protein